MLPMLRHIDTLRKVRRRELPSPLPPPPPSPLPPPPHCRGQAGCDMETVLVRAVCLSVNVFLIRSGILKSLLIPHLAIAP